MSYLFGDVVDVTPIIAPVTRWQHKLMIRLKIRISYRRCAIVVEKDDLKGHTMTDYASKVVLITGANGGLGQGVVRRYADAGATLVLGQRGADPLQACPDGPVNCYTVGLDATDPASVDAAVRQIEAQPGRIDVLAHTVGGYAAGQPVHEAGLDVWDKMMALNAKAVYVTAGRVARHMVERDISGSMVVVLAKAALKGSRNHAAYAASKAAAQRIVESMAVELGEHGIRINAVMPGTIDTPANREAMPNADFSTWQTPEAIADVMLFLTSDAAALVNGDSIAL